MVGIKLQGQVEGFSVQRGSIAPWRGKVGGGKDTGRKKEG